jgi:hypothetical protein
MKRETFIRPTQDFASLGITDAEGHPVYPGLRLVDEKGGRYDLASFSIESHLDGEYADVVCNVAAVLPRRLGKPWAILPFNNRLEGFLVEKGGTE